MNFHGVPPAVVTAGMEALDDPEVAAGLTGEPDAVASSLAAVIAAALAEFPREECRRVGHATTVIEMHGRPRWITCGRCEALWDASPRTVAHDATGVPDGVVNVINVISAPAAEAAEPDGPQGRTAAAPPPRRAKAAGGRAPNRQPPTPAAPAPPPKSVSPATAPLPPEAQASDPPGGAVADDTDDGDGEDGDPQDLPTCTSCGGTLESKIFASEVAKAFKGAVLCRSCLLTCESCGKAIDGNETHGALEQARFSFIRWRNRLCMGCHREAGSQAPDPAAAAS